MATVPSGPDETPSSQVDKVIAFSHKYHEDAGIRARVETDARDVLIEHGFVIPPTLEVQVVANDDDTVYFVLPPDPNTDLADKALAAVVGGCSGGFWDLTYNLGIFAPGFFDDGYPFPLPSDP